MTADNDDGPQNEFENLDLGGSNPQRFGFILELKTFRLKFTSTASEMV